MADGIIGSVGVSVIPDAQDFWRRFEAQTSAAAAQAGRRAGDEWQRGFRAGAGDTDIRVRADTAQARAQIAALNKDGSQQSQGLLSALLSLAPALVPLAGAAALGGAALGAMGVQGVLAVNGIKTEIKAASAEGLQFSAGLNLLKGDLATLEQTAAHNVLGAFQQATAKLHADLPAVNADLAQSSKVLGDIGGHLLGAVVGGEHTFAPALLAVEQQVDKLASRFESWATGPGGQRFATALAEDFRQVEPVVEDVAAAVGHLIAASNGTGMAIIDELDVFARVLKSIPTPVLSALVAGIVGLRVASIVTGLMDKLAVSIRGVAVAEGEAAASTRLRGGLASTVGVLGKVTAGWLALSIATDSASKATASWQSDSDIRKRFVADTAASLSDVAHLDFTKLGSDLWGANRKAAEANAQFVGQLQADLYHQLMHQNDTAVQTLTRDGNSIVISGHGSLSPELEKTAAATAAATHELTQGEQIQRAYAAATDKTTAALARQRTVLTNTVAHASVTQVSDAYTAADKALQTQINSTEKFLSLGGQTVETYKGVKIGANTYATALEQTNGDVNAATGLIHAAVDALGQQKKALLDNSTAQQNISTFLSDVSTKYGLTTEQVDVYSTALGLNAAQIAKGGASLKDAEAEFGAMIHTLANGSAALDAWIATAAQFKSGADTAASRAALLGAALVAANGDMLGYANTMASAATANQQLVTDFKNLGKGVLDLKTGTIDYHRAGAAPLLNDLQQLQTAAMNAASATYQHELATKGAKQAADDAFAVYKNDTRGALMDEATHLGLTAGQAKKLADQYFGIKNSGDLKKQIELLGGDKVDAALKGILQDLDIMAGKTTVLNVEIQASNAANISSGRGVATGGTAKHYASGTGQGGLPEGWSWVGDPGPHSELIHKQGNRADVLSHTQSVAMAAKLGTKVPGFASGTESGGFSGVDYSGNANKNGVVKNSTSSAISSLLSASQALAQTAASSSSTASDIQSASQSLNDAAKSAKVSQAERAYLTARESQLTSLARRRDAVEARLGTAPSAPTAYERLGDAQSKLQGERSTVTGAFSGSFNVSSAGQQQYGEPLTFASINSDLRKAVANATAFNSALHRLAKEGLNKTLLQQLAEAGPQALPQAKALLAATPKQLASLNSEYRSLGKQSASAGSFIANDLYKAGVDSAQGLVNGLRSKESALSKEMRKIGQSMAAELRSSLGIKSPSKVTHEIGLFTGEGLRLGLAAKRAAIAAEATRMGNAAIPAGIRSLNDPAFGGAGATQTIHLAQHIHNPIPEPPSRTSPAALRRAAYALGR